MHGEDTGPSNRKEGFNSPASRSNAEFGTRIAE